MEKKLPHLQEKIRSVVFTYMNYYLDLAENYIFK